MKIVENAPRLTGTRKLTSQIPQNASRILPTVEKEHACTVQQGPSGSFQTVPLALS